MADVITNKQVLSAVVGFADGDDRTINLDNPKDDLTSAQVQAWIDYAKDNDLIIGDKTGAKLVDIISADIIDKTSTDLDITSG